MNNLKEEQERLKFIINNEKKELDKIKQNKYVISYIAITEELNNNFNRLNAIELEIEKEQYKTCNHIFVVVANYLVDIDPHKGETYQSCYGCIKCGLDGKKKPKHLQLTKKESVREIIIGRAYLDSLLEKRGITLRFNCNNFVLAKLIYQRILSNYPELSSKTLVSDEIVLKYFENIYKEIEKSISSKEKSIDEEIDMIIRRKYNG